MAPLPHAPTDAARLLLMARNLPVARSRDLADHGIRAGTLTRMAKARPGSHP